MFTNREWALSILAVAFIGFAAVRHPEVLKSFRQVWRSFWTRPIITGLALYGLWIVVVVWVGSVLSLWGRHLVKDTVLWFLSSGLVLLMNTTEAGKERGYFRHRALEAFEIALVITFVLNLTVFSLFIEIPLQFVIILLAMCSGFASVQTEYASARKVCNVLLTLIIVAMLVATAVDIYGRWDELDGLEIVQGFLLNLWLPLLALPFIYALALYMEYEVAFVRMKFANDRTDPSLRARLSTILGLHVRLYDIHRIAGGWVGNVARGPSLLAGVREARKFSRHLDQVAAEDRAAQ